MFCAQDAKMSFCFPLQIFCPPTKIPADTHVVSVIILYLILLRCASVAYILKHLSALAEIDIPTPQFTIKHATQYSASVSQNEKRYECAHCITKRPLKQHAIPNE